MSVGKRVAYIKGLAKGLDIDTSTKEGKLLNEIIDVLEDMALEIEEIQEDITTLDDELCQVSDDLELLEDVFYEDFEDDDMDHIDSGDDEPVFYEVVCPSCDNEITIDEDVLDLGSIDCPNCGEKLEFDMDSVEDESGCDCGHEHHHH